MPTRLFCWAFISVSLMKLSRDYRSECGSPTLVETYVNTAGTKRNGRGSVKSCQPNKSVASVLPVSRLFRKHFLKMHPSLSLSHSLTLPLSHSPTLPLSHCFFTFPQPIGGPSLAAPCRVRPSQV